MLHVGAWMVLVDIITPTFNVFFFFFLYHCVLQSDAAIEDYNDDGNLVDVPVTDEQKENLIAFLNKVGAIN